MKLFYSDFSPFVRKVRVVAAEKGLPLELVKTVPFDDDAEFIKANPLGKIPALIADDGKAYCDSSVICEYLDFIAPQPPLYPADSKQRLDVLRIEYLALGIIDAAVKLTIEGRRPEGTQWEKWVSRQKNAITRTAALLEQEAKNFSARPFYSDMISLVCALAYVDLRHSSLNWRDGNPDLAAWYKLASTNKSFAGTEPERL